MGNSFKIFEEAITQIEAECGKIELSSSKYITEAWGVEDQQDYLNQVIQIDTLLTPEQLLSMLLKIEKKFGRERKEKWSARTLDLDILFYNDIILETKALIIPHPRLHLRRFTLAPLNEIAPNLIHPELKKSINSIYKNCKDNLTVKRMG